MCFDRPAGPWRPDLRQMRRDAIEAGLGCYDEWGKFFVIVPGDVETRRAVACEAVTLPSHARSAPNYTANDAEAFPAAQRDIPMRRVGRARY